MGKTFKKIDLKEYVDTIEEEDLDEFIDLDGSLIDKNDNYKATDKDVKAPGTNRDHARKTSQGPASYYPWGGAYYGGYYSMNEEDDILDDDTETFEGDIKEEIDEIAKTRMHDLVDEMLRKTRKDSDFVKRRTDEADLMHDIEIPEFSELKTTYEKPIVARKIIHLSDLVNKHDMSGTELSIIFNYLIDNLNMSRLSDEQKEYLGDKLKYGEQEK